MDTSATTSGKIDAFWKHKAAQGWSKRASRFVLRFLAVATCHFFTRCPSRCVSPLTRAKLASRRSRSSGRPVEPHSGSNTPLEPASFSHGWLEAKLAVADSTRMTRIGLKTVGEAAVLLD